MAWRKTRVTRIKLLVRARVTRHISKGIWVRKNRWLGALWFLLLALKSEGVMKKIIIALCVLGLAGFHIAGATSGACSYNGGVNCDVHGLYATCNDGTQSSVLYSNMDECSDDSLSSRCPVPVPLCTQDSLNSYNSLKTESLRECQMNNALLGITNSTCSDQSLDLEISACQSEINAYQLAEQDHQMCVNNFLQNTITSACNSRIGYAWDSVNNKCARTNDYCQDVFGFGPNSRLLPNAATGTIPCTCAGGYQFNTQGTSCVLISAPIVPTPITAPSSSFSTASVPVTQSATINSNLKIGNSGSDVITLQRFLESKSFLTLPAGISEGYFGNVTKQALIAFQTSAGLPATGYCGAMTRAAIAGSQ